MAKTYDQITKLKEKYEKVISEQSLTIEKLTKKLDEAESDNNILRKKLYDAGEGKGEAHRLKKVISSKERENKTLENRIKDLDGSKLIATFSKERQLLINKIKNLSFSNSIFNSLAFKFKDGLDNVIEIAYRIKTKRIDDMDYFTFVFRDDIVGLLEKMFRTLLQKHEESASKFLVKLADGSYKFPSHYYVRIPALKNNTVLTNILYLINCESTGYHGIVTKHKRMKYDYETNSMVKPDKFLNLNNKDQLDAIFTLLEFMYDVFTNKDYEQNLLIIASSWFKTI